MVRNRKETTEKSKKKPGLSTQIFIALLAGALLGVVIHYWIPSSYIKDTVGVLPNILNTLYIIVVAMVIVLPLGVGAAVYLTEYAKNKKLVAAIEFATETLTGIPSLIFGLVGMRFLIQMMGLKTGVLAGGLTLVVMILPTIVRTTQESLKTVPDSYREGALAMGAGKWHMVRTVVLPNATVKIFLTATPEARAERRYKELLMKGEKHDYQNVLADVRARDYQDTHRAAAPLRQAEDAVLVDTSELNFDQSFEALKKVIQDRAK